MLTGADGTFCAGADLKGIGERAAATGSTPTCDVDGPMGPTRMLLDKPVIAAVEGYAVAGGLELALWCDLRVAAADAVFGVFCRRWGVPLVDGGTIRLPRLIGQSHALDLILTGRGVSRRRGRAPWAWPTALCAPGEALAAARRAGQRDRRVPAGVPAHRPPVELRAVGPRRCPTRSRHETELGLETIAPARRWRASARFAAGEPAATGCDCSMNSARGR